jgi:hypothetical protein
MAVQALGYLGISTQNIDEWFNFARCQGASACFTGGSV